MARKLDRGVSDYDLLIDIIFSLSPLQAKKLLAELTPRYTRKGKVHLYDQTGEENSEGKVRLLPYQYKAIRTKFGDSYVRKAFTELTSYINFLEENQDTSSKYKAKLRDYNSKTHNSLLQERGWVYEKCKSYICSERPKLSIDPYTISDFATAKEYIKNIPEDIRENAFDVQLLIIKFPELKDVDYEQ